MFNLEDNYNRIQQFYGYLSQARLTRRNFLKSLAVLSGSLVFLSQPDSAYAHPPSDIAISYDSLTKTLKAVITHQVSNPKTHFINKVDIGLNGQKIIEHQISLQDNNMAQAVSYLIPDAKTEDTVSVEAYCNISGKLKREIKITDK